MRQSFGIVGKVAEVEKCRQDAGLRDRLRQVLHEVHPEVSFRLMNGGEPLRQRKKTWGGLQHRLSLLEREGIRLPRELGDADAVGIDDVVDAAAAAWSARRIHAGDERSFPEAPTQRDASGRIIAIRG